MKKWFCSNFPGASSYGLTQGFIHCLWVQRRFSHCSEKFSEDNWFGDIFWGRWLRVMTPGIVHCLEIEHPTPSKLPKIHFLGVPRNFGWKKRFCSDFGEVSAKLSTQGSSTGLKFKTQPLPNSYKIDFSLSQSNFLENFNFSRIFSTSRGSLGSLCVFCIKGGNSKQRKTQRKFI